MTKAEIQIELARLGQMYEQIQEEDNKICENYKPEFIGKYAIESSTRKAWNISINEDSTWTKEGDFIEVTEWSNGEGWDIHIESKHMSGALQLHFTQLNALLKLLMEAGAITDGMLLNRDHEEKNETF
jgi:hypothetical protein